MTAEPTTTAAPETAAPAAEAPPAAPPAGGVAEAEARDTSKRDRMRKAAALLVAKATGTEPPAEAAPAEPEAPATEAATETTPEAAAEESPKEKARLAKALADLTARNAEVQKLRNDSKAEMAKLQAERDADRQALADLKSELERMKSDPRAALKAHGGYDAITKKVLAGELKMPTADDDLREQVTERLSPLEQKLADMQAKLDAAENARAEQQRQVEAQATRTKDLGTVRQFVEADADRFPLVSALPNGHEMVLDLCYQNQTHDIEGQTAALEEILAQQVTPFLQNEKALARLAKVDPKIREKLIGKTDERSRKTVVSSDGPRVVARDTVSAPSTPTDKPRTAIERKRAAMKMLFPAR